MIPGPDFWPTFLYYFVGTTLIVALVTSQGLGLELGTRVPLQVGMLIGLVAGLAGAYWNRSIEVCVTFRDRAVFIETLERSLAEMGFEAKSELDEFVVYEKSALSTLFAGRIFLRVEKNRATIAGRASNVRRLQQQL